MTLEAQKPVRETGGEIPRYEGPKAGQSIDIGIEVLRSMIEKGNRVDYLVTEGPDPAAIIVAIDVDWHNQLIRLHYDRPVEQAILTRTQA